MSSHLYSKLIGEKYIILICLCLNVQNCFLMFCFNIRSSPSLTEHLG